MSTSSKATLFWFCFVLLAGVSIATYLKTAETVQRWQHRAIANAQKKEIRIDERHPSSTSAERRLYRKDGPVKKPPAWWTANPWKIASDVWSSNVWNMVGALASVFALIAAFWQQRQLAHVQKSGDP